MKNNLSKNISFLEIKTHKTRLISKLYRGDDVFSVSDELSGCINQGLNQREYFQRSFLHLTEKAKDSSSNIFMDIFVESIERINPDIEDLSAPKIYEELKQYLDYEDLGKKLYLSGLAPTPD